MGLTPSDAFRLLLKRIAAEKSLPFEPLVPNAETIEAMKAARRGDLTTAGKPANLLPPLRHCERSEAIQPALATPTHPTGKQGQGSALDPLGPMAPDPIT